MIIKLTLASGKEIELSKEEYNELSKHISEIKPTYIPYTPYNPYNPYGPYIPSPSWPVITYQYSINQDH